VEPEICPRRQDCARHTAPRYCWHLSFCPVDLGRSFPGNNSARTDKLDVTRVGAFGHSPGGAEALQFCHDDSRCKAGIDLDGAPFGTVVRTGMSQPFLFLMSDHTGELDGESNWIQANFRSLYA
jgi:hypothetical protein